MGKFSSQREGEVPRHKKSLVKGTNYVPGNPMAYGSYGPNVRHDQAMGSAHLYPGGAPPGAVPPPGGIPGGIPPYGAMPAGPAYGGMPQPNMMPGQSMGMPAQPSGMPTQPMGMPGQMPYPPAAGTAPYPPAPSPGYPPQNYP